MSPPSASYPLVTLRTTAQGSAGPAAAAALATRAVPATLHSHRAAAPLFRPDDKLLTAVNVALSVGAPLLVTGEPGTGKTQIAWWLAWYFDLLEHGSPFSFHVKSNSVSTDLLYQYDNVAYFAAGREGGAHLDKTKYRTKGPLWCAIDEASAGRASVVLIDEIDKAPRDFPNDLLHELDEFRFVARETREEVRRPEGAPPPVVVITSNSERRLPEPFLRRCVFHHIAFNEELLQRAVKARRHDTPHLAEGVRERAIRVVGAIRNVPGLRKKPSTGELLVWLVALQAAGATAAQLDLEKVKLGELPALSALVKDSGDLEALAR